MPEYDVRLVLFDWDMTLGAALGRVSWSERTTALFQHVGLAFEHDQIAAALDKYWLDVYRNHMPQKPPSQTREALKRYYQQVLAILGQPDPDLKLSEQIYIAYAYLPFELYASTLPTLQALLDRGFQVGVITNHAPDIRPTIEAMLGAYIGPSQITISGELEIYKPAAGIFLKTAERFGVPVEQCMYVGDNLEVDAIAAVEKGGYAAGLWYDQSEREPPSKLPDNVHRITDLGAVMAYVNSRSPS